MRKSKRQEVDQYQQLCLWETGEQQVPSTGEPLDANLWLFIWGKEHGYPGIQYQFGRTGYYLSHGIAADSWIHIDEGYEHWEYACTLGTEPYVSIAVRAIQTGKICPVENKPIKPIIGGWSWTPDVIARLSLYSQANVTDHGLHDTIRREALRRWAEDHNYKQVRYSCHEDGGYTSQTIEAGKETWERFVEESEALAVYCAYIATHTKDHISHFLEGKP